MANTPQPSFMNRLKQFNPFTRKNNGATVPPQGPSFFNRINPFKKNNVELPSTSTFVNAQGGKRNGKSRKSKKSRKSRKSRR